jgi:ATP-dependent RNA helicase DeaD
MHLVEKVKNTEIHHEEIGTFLPAVYEQLKGITKEEIIQRFVSAEFNRFLSYYRNARDIKVELRKESGRQGRRPDAGSGSVRLFINLGQMEKINDRGLIKFLREAANITDLKIANVEVTRSCSFFETDAAQAEFLMAKLKKVRFLDRRVQIEYADKGKSRGKGDYKRERGNRDYSKATNSFFAKKRQRR